MASRNIHYSKLVELGSSGYEIVADEPDIRKWRVANANGKILGVVDELLVDRQLNKIRYIVVDMQGRPLNLLSRKILIPIGIAQLDRVDDIVILPTITVEHLATLPTYKKGKLTFEIERKIRNVFTPSNATADYNNDVADDSFYQDDYFDDRNFYEGRKKKFNRNDRDVVDNNRDRNDERQQEGLPPFREGVMEITEQSEVPVVTKQTRVVEEVSVNKDVSERDEKIKDSVRRNEVEIEHLDKNE